MSIFSSLRVRLTVWYVVLLGITLAVFSAGVYVAMRESLYSNLDDSLESRSALVAGIVAQTGELDVREGQLPGAGEDGEEIVRVFDASGELLFDNSRGEPPPDASAVADALAGDPVYRQDSIPGADLRFRVAPIRSEGEVIGVVEVALSRGDAQEALTALLTIIAIAYPLALLVTSAGGVFLANRALSPIDRLTRVARRISAEDLSQRLDMKLPDDEVGRLARTFDEMIARLDESFRRQRQFTADASHELRTPLTAIKGQTEVALQRERQPEEYRDVLQTVNGEVDRMIRLVGSLLTLARADAAQIPLIREDVDVGRLVNDAVDQIRPAAEEKGLELTVSAGQELRVAADQDLLLQLVLNLLDNAVKYTPSGGSIRAGWERGEREAVISVADTGTGIPPEHLLRVFDRFYRVDSARTRAQGGSGLGLSISRWIAEAHGGTISGDSTPGTGSRFVVRLPLG